MLVSHLLTIALLMEFLNAFHQDKQVILTIHHGQKKKIEMPILLFVGLAIPRVGSPVIQ